MKMKKITILFLLGLVGSVAYGQKFKTVESNIRFYSDAPIEDIEAINTESTSIVDLDSKSIVFVVPIEDFTFKKELMQEHFNENYLESEKYPKAIFKGKIDDWTGEKGEFSVVANGEMSLHGIERQIAIEGTIVYDDDGIKISTVFSIELKDYKIKIPKAVFYNIAEVVEVTASFQYQPYEQN